MKTHLLLVAAMYTGLAYAEPTFPVKPIRAVVHSAPGSPPDVVMRIVGDRLAVILGQPVVVENRPGASGTLALAAVARAEPDGYTIGTMSPAQAVAPSLLPRLPYDTMRDLAPVRQITEHPLILLARSSLPSASIAELVSAAKTRPGQITIASAGQGTPPHLAAELFRARGGVDLHHVPYKGASAAMGALVGEHVDLLFATPITAATPLRSGKARALAVTGPSRLAGVPQLATFGELGYSGFETRDWQGMVAPAAVPKAIIRRVAAAVEAALADPEVRSKLMAIGMEPIGAAGPEDFGTLIRAELTRWAGVVRETGMRVD